MRKGADRFFRRLFAVKFSTFLLIAFFAGNKFGQATFKRTPHAIECWSPGFPGQGISMHRLAIQPTRQLMQLHL